MKPDLNLELVASVAALLDESIDLHECDAAIKKLEDDPALMESLMAVQFVNDAMQGNPCLDKRYTARIMQYIAMAQQRRIGDDKNDK